MIAKSRPVNKNVSTDAVITAKRGIEPGVHKLLANCQAGGYKFRPMSGWNVRIGLQPFIQCVVTGGGFSTAADRQHPNAFIQRGVCAGLYSTGDSTIQQLVEDADNKLFSNILNNPDHTLHYLLPEQTTHDYELRPRCHNLELSC